MHMDNCPVTSITLEQIDTAVAEGLKKDPREAINKLISLAQVKMSEYERFFSEIEALSKKVSLEEICDEDEAIETRETNDTAPAPMPPPKDALRETSDNKNAPLSIPEPSSPDQKIRDDVPVARVAKYCGNKKSKPKRVVAPVFTRLRQKSRTMSYWQP